MCVENFWKDIHQPLTVVTFRGELNFTLQTFPVLETQMEKRKIEIHFKVQHLPQRALDFSIQIGKI